MSLLSRFLDEALRATLSTRVTPGGIRLEDVIRSGTRHPDSSVGVYAPDAQSYQTFRELFAPILQAFQAPKPCHQDELACLNPAAVVSTRVRVARNLAEHAFTAGMARFERVKVEEKIVRACAELAKVFPGTVVKLSDVSASRLDTMVAERRAFGSYDKYMAAADIHADWPIGRSVFNSQKGELSVWINEEDHLRVAVVMPGPCIDACAAAMDRVMAILAAHLEFCVDAQIGHLTSCPSNVGSAMRASYWVNLHADPSQELLLSRLESAGFLQIRGPAGEHSPRAGGLVDVSFRNRVGSTESRLLQDMKRLFVEGPRDAGQDSPPIRPGL
ncbi:MAG: hypothetical protein V4731_10790 [Pseudomonadota bacterium]